MFSTDQNIYNLSPGNYTVTITDENNCLISQTYEIVDPQIIDVTYSYDPIICNGDNTVLSLEISGGVPPYTINYNGEDPDMVFTHSRLQMVLVVWKLLMFQLIILMV